MPLEDDGESAGNGSGEPDAAFLTREPTRQGVATMDMNADMEQTVEIVDALGACDELHAVLARLKRMGLLTDEEDLETRDNIQSITDTLTKKLPDETE